MEGEANYMFPIIAEEGTNLPEGAKLTDIYGFEAKLSKTVSAEGETCVGAFCWQSDSNNWAQHEFCQEGGDKDVFIGKDGVVKYVSKDALFAADDTWAKAFIAEWSWDGDNQIDFSVSDFKLLDKDGNVLGAAAAEDPKEDDKKDEDSKAEDKTEDKTEDKQAETKKDDTQTTGNQPSSKTGDAGVGAAVAGLALAGAAAIVARKRK